MRPLCRAFFWNNNRSAPEVKNKPVKLFRRYWCTLCSSPDFIINCRGILINIMLLYENTWGVLCHTGLFNCRAKRRRECRFIGHCVAFREYAVECATQLPAAWVKKYKPRLF